MIKFKLDHLLIISTFSHGLEQDIEEIIKP